jgi:hypothetical protein
MPIVVSCPRCGHQGTVPDNTIGCSCSKCSARFPVTASVRSSALGVPRPVHRATLSGHVGQVVQGKVGSGIVQISARIISWPSFCACCSQPATTSLGTSYTRTTGKRVIHHDTRVWQIPYCQDCVKHVREANSATRWRANRIWMDVCLGFLLSGVLILGCHQSIPSESLKYVLDIVVVSSVALLVAFLCRRVQREFSTKITIIRARAPASCCSVYRACHYNGWYGTVHTFRFCNAHFVDALRRANPGKCVD